MSKESEESKETEETELVTYQAILILLKRDGTFGNEYPLELVKAIAPVGLQGIYDGSTLAELLADNWRVICTQRVDGAILYTLSTLFESATAQERVEKALAAARAERVGEEEE